MLTIEKLAVVGWDSASTKWPADECERLFSEYGSQKDDGSGWDKARWSFNVFQPGMRVVGKKTDGTPKLGVDQAYTREQAVLDAGEMFDTLGRDKYVRHSCNGFDLGARKDAPPKTTLSSRGLSDNDKACWCLNNCSAKEKTGKTVTQLVALYEAKNAA